LRLTNLDFSTKNQDLLTSRTLFTDVV